MGVWEGEREPFQTSYAAIMELRALWTLMTSGGNQRLRMYVVYNSPVVRPVQGRLQFSHTGKQSHTSFTRMCLPILVDLIMLISN